MNRKDHHDLKNVNYMELNLNDINVMYVNKNHIMHLIIQTLCVTNIQNILCFVLCVA